MEAITHNLIGIVIQIICFSIFSFPINLILTIILGIGSHFFSDLFVNLTYHTPEPNPNDKFWVIWHIIIAITSGFSIIIFFIPFFIGMISANLVDIIDWIILRGYRKLKSQKVSAEGKKNFYIHDSITKIRDKFLMWLPDWRYKKSAIISEIILIIALLFLIFYLY